MDHVFNLVFNKILILLAHMTFYSVSAVIGYVVGYKRLEKYNNNKHFCLFFLLHIRSRSLLAFTLQGKAVGLASHGP